MRDPENRPDSGRDPNGLPTRPPAAAAASVSAASAQSWPQMIAEMPDDAELHMDILDILNGMERAIPKLPRQHTWRASFEVQTRVIRRELGLDRSAA